jgi:lipoprotein-anchoring transpeptidase ErfK/SrfK
MTDAIIKSRQIIDQARTALQNGDRAQARRLAEEAARLTPQSEDPWLILAAVASPRASVDYLNKALAINPESPRALKGMEWATKRLQESPKAAKPSTNGTQAKVAQGSGEKKKRGLLFPILLFILGCIVVFAAAWSAVRNPALAAILTLSSTNQVSAPTAQPPSWAQAEIAKPTYTATLGLPTFTPTSTLHPLPTETFTPEPTFTPEDTATPENTATPQATETPGVMEAAIVPDTPTSEYVAPTAGSALADVSAVPAAASGQHWIDVDLTNQRVYAYQGSTVMNTFVVSTGTWQYPTVTGSYKIWIKLLSTTMAGPGYYLTNVPYTMYFYKGYGLHGTYWHNNFGTPMSHGCVNLRTSDAEWLYNFASVGTTVNVHY